MPKFSGTKDLDIELLPNGQVRLTLGYKSSYEAAIAYDEITAQARTGNLKLNMSLGEVLEQGGPQPPQVR
jgi:hypothetical protein